MSLGCFGNTLKCLFIFFNVIFALVGAATVGFGVYLKVSPQASELMQLIEADTDVVYLAYGSWFIIGFGALVFIIAFFGCVGAATSSRCLLGLYIILAILIVIGQIAAFIFTVMFVVRSDDIMVFEKQIRSAFVKQYTPDNPKFKKSWDTIQIWFSCCGISNFTDYYSLKNKLPESVPLSCCKQGDGATADAMKLVNKVVCITEAKVNTGIYTQLITKGIAPLNRVLPCDSFVRATAASSFNDIGWRLTYDEGCFTKLKEKIKEYSTVLLIIEAVVIAITMIGMIIAVCLCRRHDKKDL